MLTRVSWLISAAVLFSCQAAYAQHPCENLVNLKLPHTLITAATSVPEGAAPAPSAPGAAAAGPGAVPAHCDVRGVIRPSGDSNIKFALWLPATAAWNAKYRQEGNGGWAGAINTAALQSRCAAAMPSPGPTMGMKVAPAQTGPSGIRRS